MHILVTIIEKKSEIDCHALTRKETLMEKRYLTRQDRGFNCMNFYT